MTDGIISFQRAARRGTNVLVSLYGSSGSGKTYSALRLARGFVGPEGKIGVIDTETGRALVYANLVGGWLHAELTPPFTPERYIDAIHVAGEAKLDALIIDSASHIWSGLGGVLDLADAGRDREGQPLKGLVKWMQPKIRYKKFVQALLLVRIPLIIVCLRAKEKMVQKGSSIVSDGWVPEAEKSLIFEMTVQALMSREKGKLGTYTLEKCPEDLLSAFPDGAQISEVTGRKIKEWFGGAAPVDRSKQELIEKARANAEQGMAALKAFFDALGRDDKLKLQPEMPNLKSIATEADREGEQQAKVERETPRDQDAALADPFGGGAKAEPEKAANGKPAEFVEAQRGKLTQEEEEIMLRQSDLDGDRRSVPVTPARKVPFDPDTGELL